MGLEPYYTYYDKNNPQSFEMMETAKASKRAALQNEMNQCYQDIVKVNAQLSLLEKEQQNLNEELEAWKKNKASFHYNNPILPYVVTPHKFEGIIAEKIQADMEMCISQMDMTCEDIAGLINNIDLQFGKLKQQIATLNGRVRDIQKELNTL